MHQCFTAFAGSDNAEQYFMAGGDAEADVLKDKFAGGHAARWGRLPPNVSIGDVHALRLFDQSAQHETLPSMVSELSALEFLGLPAHLFAALEPRALPASVRTIWVETEGAVDIPAISVFPSIERIVSASFRKPILNFEPESFPNLRHLHLKFDRRARMLKVLPRMTRLVELCVGPCAARHMFDALQPLRLEFLILWRGALAALDGIEALPTLTDLRVMRLTKLMDLGALAKLPQLRELSILDCPHLTKVSAIPEVRQLERLTLWGCRDNDGAIARIKPRLEARGLKELTIT